MPFFPEAQAQFTGKFNLQLHVAFIFYVLGAVWTGIACLVSLFAIWWGLLGYVVVFLISVSHPFTSSSAIPFTMYLQSNIVCNHLPPNLLRDRHSRARPSCDDTEYCGGGSRGTRVRFAGNLALDLDGICAFVPGHDSVVYRY